MPNDSRNNYELPCYMDVGSKLFPEAPPGQGLDLTNPNTRDQAFKKHIIGEEIRRGMKPVPFWMLSHRDVEQHNPTHGPTGTDVRGEGAEAAGQFGDGIQRRAGEYHTDGVGGPIPPVTGPVDPNTRSSNFYHEQLDKVFNGPIPCRGSYIPAQQQSVLMDFGVEKPVNDLIFFERDPIVRQLGRLPEVGDVYERFDGLMMEILTSVPFQAENFEWLFQQCTAASTNKTRSMLFRD